MKLIDTNVLIDYPEILDEGGSVIHLSCLGELDDLKYKKRDLIGKINYAGKKIQTSNVVFDASDVSDAKVDDKLISIAKEKDYILVTNDILLFVKASATGVKVENYKPNKEVYNGYRVVQIPNYVLSTLGVNHDSQVEAYRRYIKQFDFHANEYIVCTDIFDQVLKIFTSSFEVINDSSFKNSYSGDIKPINLQQRLVFDMLKNDELPIKLITGRFGSGKDFLMINYALKLIEEGEFNNITWIRNNIQVKDSEDIGFLPGSLLEKVLPFAMPLADHLGGTAELMEKIGQGVIQLEHLGFIRGRNIENSIIYCTEIENMTVSQIQLIISRVGQGSILLMNGDSKQVDKEVFRLNDTITKVIDKFKDNDLFGYVNLKHTERSEIAKMADLLD
jgi:PhoH-like ATPase